MSYFWPLLFSILMAMGQFLFKKAALVSQGESFLWGILNIWMLPAIVLYAVATLLWIWILRHTPLSTAYPFVALAFVFVPIGSVFLFDEILSMRYLLGCSLIAGGIILTVV